MLETAVAILLCLLPLQVNGLVTANARCLAGYDWMFSSIGQSPCDVAEELLEVCSGGPGTHPIIPLPVNSTYSSPTSSNENSCTCSSVVYSLLCACATCQQRAFYRWASFVTNCETTYLTVYAPPIPDGVKVPAYAYLNVSTTGFDPGLAQSVKAPESSGPPSPSASGGSTTINNTPAIVGGVVGGVIGLGLVVVLIGFLVLRRKQKPSHNSYELNFQRSSNKGFVSNTTVPSTLPPGSPDGTNHSNADPGTYDPYRQHSPQNNERARYSGMPEL